MESAIEIEGKTYDITVDGNNVFIVGGNKGYKIDVDEPKKLSRLIDSLRGDNGHFFDACIISDGSPQLCVKHRNYDDADVYLFDPESIDDTVARLSKKINLLAAAGRGKKVGTKDIFGKVLCLDDVYDIDYIKDMCSGGAYNSAVLDFYSWEQTPNGVVGETRDGYMTKGFMCGNGKLSFSEDVNMYIEFKRKYGDEVCVLFKPHSLCHEPDGMSLKFKGVVRLDFSKIPGLCEIDGFYYVNYSDFYADGYLLEFPFNVEGHYSGNYEIYNNRLYRLFIGKHNEIEGKVCVGNSHSYSLSSNCIDLYSDAHFNFYS